MRRFGLCVQLASERINDCSSCEFSEVLASSKGPQESFFVANVVDFSISFEGQPTDNDNNIMALVVLVSPALIDSALSELNLSSQQCWVEETLEGIGIADNILGRIHPLIRRRLKIKGIFVASGEPGFPRGNPADLVLLDPSSISEGSIEDLFLDLNGEALSSHPCCVLKMLAISKLESSNKPVPDTGPAFRIPPCPVCLHRIDPWNFSQPRPHNHQRCSTFCPVPNEISCDSCINERFLRVWDSPSLCPACHVIQTLWKKPYIGDNLFCNRCAKQETLWVCLTCGFVGCGWYSQKHAAEHFDESKHPFSLELATLRIWNYASGKFAHRTDILECASIRKYHPLSDPYLSFAQVQIEDQVNVGFAKAKYEYEGTFATLPSESPKKATMIGEEYEALLQSALEDQAQHYEGEISRLRAELTAEQIDRDKMTQEEMQQIERLDSNIIRLRSDIDHVARKLLEAQAQEAGHKAVLQRLLQEQGVAEKLLEKIKEETTKEHEAGRVKVEELEQQVADLSGNLRMRDRISKDEELNKAHIFGTTTSPKPSSTKWGGRKGKRSIRK